MTPDDFRRIALSFPETEERAHQDHPDFRVGGKIFATLGYRENGWAMVKLTPEEQHNFVGAWPAAFAPVAGAWGRHGSTSVRLTAAHKAVARRALAAAWRNTAPKRVVERFEAS
ncbi:MAG: MmcQ/YjbR family DNA-binding protein [Bryobacteraceae bacterium]